jgi:ABC-type multidrug transport system ATPase subunit
MLQLDLTLVASSGHGALRASATFGQGATLLTGPSGAGKSTLLALVAGAIPPQSGTLRWRNQTWSDGPRLLVPSHLRGIGWQPQSPSLQPGWTARDHLDATYRFRPQRLDLEARAIDRLQLGPLMARRAGQLSAGESQRVALLRAIMACQGLLLVDEPVTALPPELARRAIELIASLTYEQGWTAIVVSHQPLEGLVPAAHLELEDGLLRKA